MKLLRGEIRGFCDASTYQRGNSLYLTKKILETDVNVEEESVTLTGRIRGTAAEPYRVKVRLKRADGDNLTIADYECECPAYDNWYGMCKHCVGLCLSYSDQLKTQQGVARMSDIWRRSNHDTDSELMDVLQRYSAAQEEKTKFPPESFHIDVEFARKAKYSYNYSANQLCAEIRCGTDRLYVIKDMNTFVWSVIHGTEYQYGKKMTVRHSQELFDPLSRKMLRILIEAVRETEPYIDNSHYYRMIGGDRFLALNNAQAAALMRLSMESCGKVTIDHVEYVCADHDPPVDLIIQQSDRGATLSVPSFSRVSAEPTVVYLKDGTAYFCSDTFQRQAHPFLYAMGSFNRNADARVEKYLSERDFSRFAAFVLPELKTVMSVDEGEVDFSTYLPQTPEFCFYLSAAEQGGVSLRAEVSYGESAFPLEAAGNEYRNITAEQPVAEAVSLYFPHMESTVQRKAVTDDEVYRVLTEGLEKLRECGSVFVDDSLRAFRLAPNPTASVGVALHGDLIDVEVESGGYSAAEINEILDAYRLRKKYYRLKTGEFLSLTDGGLSVVAELSDSVGLRFDKTGKAQTPAFRAAYINAVLNRDDNGVDLRRDAAFRAQINALNHYRDDDREIPPQLNASLRGYQKAGYRWLCALTSCSLGGILADDMGLGKTVQMLSCFLSEGKNFLVVCPASLIYNWESECRRFAPTIPCRVLRGTEKARKRELENDGGLTITSYDQLKRDIGLYQNKVFDFCVLDEAQYIRNAETKAAKAVKQIKALHRFALTGTPIENRLSDLWSIFDFLMPGYLFSKQVFQTRVEQPVVEGDAAAKERLTRLTSPFILRRKKADVLRELPDKQEAVVYVEMTDPQRKLYQAQEQALRLTLQNAADAEYLHHKIEYLAALTRLRQICCTPELYLENYEGGSGKIDACMELLAEGAESGHRTLVFSQFTGMLELLIQRAGEAGLRWLYLSGKNTSEQRRDMVQQFQGGEYSVFFISLKAGGTGLNLTAADRVVHFDPWWNIAAEEQATDRTHRIGQRNKVLVTKLVCRDTVEERILTLQERKRELSDLVMDSESVRSATLDKAALLALLQDESATR